MSNQKTETTYKTIGQVTKELGLINKENGSLQTHTLRYWETQFKQIKPYVRAGRRRYNSEKNFKLIKLIKFLLKDKGLTINGVKKALNDNHSLNLDDFSNKSISIDNIKIKNKLLEFLSN